MLKLFLLLVCLSSAWSLESSLFGEDINRNDTLFIHAMPHTHNDAGWLYTMEQYYTGNNGVGGCVKCILDKLPKALEDKPERKFSYVEMIFFTRWWRDQNADMKARVKKLVASKQLNLLQAGWVMNDEAVAYYEDIIDHMTCGHRFVLQEFNITPSTGWAIDPFGHSSTQAKFLRQMGFNGFFIERIEEAEFQDRRQKKSLETLWKPPQSHHDPNYDPALFTHVNYFLYWTPPVASRAIFGSSGDEPGTAFAEYVRRESRDYRTRHLVHHIGGDFVWGYGGEIPQLFENLEAAIRHFNNIAKDQNIRIAYSTPDLYLEALYNETTKPDLEIPDKHDDFMPYADRDVSYWTGYYTSRASFKYFIRQGGRRLQAMRKLLASYSFRGSAASQPAVLEAISDYEHIMGMLQHHDGISGTAKQAVTDDYVILLSKEHEKSMKKVLEVINTTLYDKMSPAYFECLDNATSKDCEPLQKLKPTDSLLLTIYNPGPYGSRVVHSKMPKWAGAKVLASNNTEIPSDYICNALDDCDIFFSDVFAALNFNSYLVVSQGTAPLKSVTLEKEFKPVEIHIDNFTTFKMMTGEQFELTKCGADKSKECIRNKFSIKYGAYLSHQPGNGDATNDGAYIFATDGPDVGYGSIASINYCLGKVVSQINITRDMYSTTIRFYHTAPQHQIEIETYLQTIAMNDNKGKNVIIRVKNEDIDSLAIFETDQNGYAMQERVFNRRYTFTPHLKESIQISAFYFPIISAIAIQDPQTHDRMTLMTDRAQGASSQRTGEVEIMIQRRLNTDDDKGVQEYMDEKDKQGKGVTTFLRHYLQFSNENKDIANPQREFQNLIDNKLMVLMSGANFSTFKDVKLLNRCGKARIDQQEKTYKEFPKLKFFVREYENATYLVRVQNMDDSKTITVPFLQERNGEKAVPLLDQFLLCDQPSKSIKVLELREKSLSFNQDLQDMLKKQYKWSKKGAYNASLYNASLQSIELGPQEIRTFEVIALGLIDAVALPSSPASSSTSRTEIHIGGDTLPAEDEDEWQQRIKNHKGNHTRKRCASAVNLSMSLFILFALSSMLLVLIH